jgi:peptide/nickel transport system substrate-binding protein
MAGFVAAAAGALVACGGRAAPTGAAPGGAEATGPATASTATAAVRPVSGGTLTIMIPSTVASINPVHEADWNSDEAIFNLFDAMLTFDNDNRPRGLLATSWEASEDAKTFTFHLRPGVKFTDGTPADAKALVENMNWIMDPANKSPEAAQRFTQLDHVEAPDPGTFVIKMKVPQIPDTFFSGFLLGPYWASPAAFADAAAFDRHPVGSGPFMFGEYVADDHLLLKRNDGFWGGRPYLDAVRVRMVPNTATQRDELLAGTVDFAFGVAASDVKTLQAKGIRIIAGSHPGLQMISVNLNSPFCADLAVRQAMAYAIDKQAIITKVLYGYADVSTTLVIPSSPGFDRTIKGYDYDPAKARQVLAADGWTPGSDGIMVRDGKPLQLTMITQNQPTWLLICQIIQQELKQVGIGVKIQQMDWATFLNNMRAGKYDIAYWSLGGTSFSSVGYTDNLLSTQYWNVSQITKNPAMADLSKQIDQIVTAAQSEIDTAKRHRLMSQFQQLVVDQLPAIPLWHTQNINAMQPWVHGLEAPSQYAICRAEKAWIAPH